MLASSLLLLDSDSFGTRDASLAFDIDSYRRSLVSSHASILESIVDSFFVYNRVLSIFTLSEWPTSIAFN